MSEPRSTWTRLRNRVRFGLATQEILDRLARLGLVVYPYFLVEEPLHDRPGAGGTYDDLELRKLGPSEAHLVASVPERPRDESETRETMSRTTCVAVFAEGELLGYTFYSRTVTGLARGPLAEGLPTDWAYLFDAYVRPVARGRGIAAFMRHSVHEMLAREGATHASSVTLVFNRSSRRFKAKLGAIERELRLVVQLGPLPGLDLRLWRGSWTVRTPRAVRASLRIANTGPDG